MKTQVIQLSQNEDVISLRDKMNWSMASRILLIWPNGGLVLNNKLDLKLVARYAFSLGAQLALVTNNRMVVIYAHELGISVFDDPLKAQDSPWGKFQEKEFHRLDNGRRKKLNDLHQAVHPKASAWLDHPLIRVFCLLISVLALLVLGTYILPSATIILSPKVENQSMVIDIIADPALSLVNYSIGSLPTYDREVIVEGQDVIDTTGMVTIPDQPAVGELQFTNSSDRTIIIPPRTVVSTDSANPIRFITSIQKDVSIKPGEVMRLPARSVKPGSSGNLMNDELVIIEGTLASLLNVTNPEATHGGREAAVPSPNAGDMDRLHQRLTSQLIHTALDKLQSILPAGDILITPTITTTATVAESAFPGVNAPGNQLELSMKIRVHAQVISGQMLSTLINPLMDANTPTGYSPQSDSLEISGTKLPALGEDGRVYWTIRATRKLSAMISSGQVTELVRSNTIDLAITRLFATLPLAKPAEIRLTPGWWPRLPFLPMRIIVSNTGVQ